MDRQIYPISQGIFDDAMGVYRFAICDVIPALFRPRIDLARLQGPQARLGSWKADNGVRGQRETPKATPPRDGVAFVFTAPPARVAGEHGSLLMPAVWADGGFTTRLGAPPAASLAAAWATCSPPPARRPA